MIKYEVEDFTEGKRHYSVGYSELRELYHSFINMKDVEFMKKLPEVSHFACIVGWFKELPNDSTIGDCGIVHELIHLMVNGPQNKYHLRKVRRQFKFMLKLD